MSGGADVVIIQWLDRFGRNPREILPPVLELEEHGVEVRANRRRHPRRTDVAPSKAGIAGKDSQRISERVRANMGKAIAKGVHAGSPHMVSDRFGSYLKDA